MPKKDGRTKSGYKDNASPFRIKSRFTGLVMMVLGGAIVLWSAGEGDLNKLAEAAEASKSPLILRVIPLKSKLKAPELKLKSPLSLKSKNPLGLKSKNLLSLKSRRSLSCDKHLTRWVTAQRPSNRPRFPTGHLFCTYFTTLALCFGAKNRVEVRFSDACQYGAVPDDCPSYLCPD